MKKFLLIGLVVYSVSANAMDERHINMQPANTRHIVQQQDEHFQSLTTTGTRDGNTSFISTSWNLSGKPCSIYLERGNSPTAMAIWDSVYIGFDIRMNGTYRFTDINGGEPVLYYRTRIVFCNGGSLVSNMIALRDKDAISKLSFDAADRQLVYETGTVGKLEIINALGNRSYVCTIPEGSGTMKVPADLKGVCLARINNEKPIRIKVR